MHIFNIKKIFTNIHDLSFKTIIILLILLDLALSIFITLFIYEPNTDYRLYLFFIIFIPSVSMIIATSFIIKFIIDAFHKKEGSHLKLLIIVIMTIITLLPSIIISSISTYIIKYNLDLFLNNKIYNSLSYFVNSSNNDIIEKQNSMVNYLKRFNSNFFNNLYRRIDFDNISNNVNTIEFLKENDFENLVILSNSYYGSSTVLFNTQNFLPIDINYKIKATNITFANSEYNGLFYINAIIPLRETNNYIIWSKPMTSNFIEIRNNSLESFRLYNSINMFTNEFSAILKILYILILGISVFFSILLGIFLSRIITKPIGLILSATESIMNFNFDINMKLVVVHDLRNLINRFNLMARSLKYHRDREKRAARLETWREATLKVAHEIKNPLMPIILNAELIKLKLKNNMTDEEIDKLRNSINIIIKNSNTISNLTKSFSEYSFSVKLSDNDYSINDIINEVVDSFKGLETIEFFLSLSSYDHFMRVDREKLIIAFRNLIKNSIEALENSVNKYIYISSYHELINNNIVYTISITDTGLGIEEKNLAKIFEPYYTSKDNGTGIGLATVEKIIVEHNGTIEVHSIPNEGTTFLIHF